MLAANETQNQPDLPTVASFFAEVAPQMEALTSFMEEQVAEFEPELQELVEYCLRNQGKRLRPMLMFYSGWKEDAPIQPDLVRAAGVVELVHLATLVHDDILDDASLRHNLDTVSEKYGSSVAVLLGDALFSQALNLATHFPTVEVCREVSLATRRVCAGEIRQTFERGNPNFPLEEYFRVIDLKTAELFHVSCFLGARLAGYSEDFVKAVASFGRHLGMAYQIFDDLADFLGDEGQIGKTLGTDLASGKYTLPILLHLQQLPEEEQATLIQRLSDKTIDPAEMSEAMKATGVLEATKTYFEKEVIAAEAALKGFESEKPVEHLLSISTYVGKLLGRLTLS